MNKQVRGKLEMVARVRTFSRAHPSAEPGYSLILSRLEERLSRAEAIMTRQHEAVVAARGARGRRSELRRKVHFSLLPYLVAVGGVVAKDRADLEAQFRLPKSNATHQGFLTATKSIVAAAEAQRELLIAEGMAPTLLDELGRLVAEFETATEAARAGRLSHIRARTDLEGITAELVEQVRVLDGINKWRFVDEPEALLEWNAAKLVYGPSRIRAVPPASGEGVVPPDSGGVAPAA